MQNDANLQQFLAGQSLAPLAGFTQEQLQQLAMGAGSTPGGKSRSRKLPFLCRLCVILKLSISYIRGKHRPAVT